MNEDIGNQENDIWSKGCFIESVDSRTIKEKRKTLHKESNEKMNFDCKKCGKKISAHNKDWHAHMCDDCFNKTFFPND